VAAAAPRVDQSSPAGIVRREHLAHDQAQPSISRVAAGDLRRESQELLVDDVLRLEDAQ